MLKNWGKVSAGVKSLFKGGLIKSPQTHFISAS